MRVRSASSSHLRSSSSHSWFRHFAVPAAKRTPVWLFDQLHCPLNSQKSNNDLIRWNPFGVCRIFVAVLIMQSSFCSSFRVNILLFSVLFIHFFYFCFFSGGDQVPPWRPPEVRGRRCGETRRQGPQVVCLRAKSK